MIQRLVTERAAGFLLVLAAHAAALWGLWSHRILVVPDEVATLFVETITTPPPPPKEPPKPARLEKPKVVDKSRPQQLVAEVPVNSPAEPVAPPPSPPAEAAPARPAGPVTLGSELAVACPERTAPAYPPLSRRLGEEGKVVLRVELDEQGNVSSVHVATASGYPRLDEAAAAAVKTWRCSPARRDGQPVRAVARQPFKFILDGR